jgi:uracil-DNA glycosylase
VIVGQDSYHGLGQAHGLAFSVPPTEKIPPSLRKILAEWDSDIGGPRPLRGSLEPWARHGVLLLNTVLTVRRGEANSHRGLGWQQLTTAIINAVSAEPRPIAFLLWGQSAHRCAKWIAAHHVVVKSSHPSPLSATRGDAPFIASKPFSAVNGRLKAFGEPPIDWSLVAAS